jgi:hypothetical protein
MGYTVIDLGSDAIPAVFNLSVDRIRVKSLGDAGDAVLTTASAPHPYFLRLFSGAIVNLPEEIGYPMAVAATTDGDRLVIGQVDGIFILPGPAFVFMSQPAWFPRSSFPLRTTHTKRFPSTLRAILLALQGPMGSTTDTNSIGSISPSP